MVYLLSLLALTLNPAIWRTYGRSKGFLIIQALRLLIGLAIVFFFNYFVLVDHTIQALISYGLFIWAIFLFADGIFIKAKRFYATPLVGLLCALAGAYMVFVYPLTLADDKYAFVNAKAKVISGKTDSVDEKHIPVVPEEYARYRSEKLLGELPHSSYYDLGDSTLQKIDGTLYWVTPIEYTGFFKWLKADAVPGYIKMNAEDENAEPEWIKTDMIYIPSAYFGQDLKRHVRAGHPSEILLDPSFEPDDNGHPYYVVPYGKYNKFRNILDIKGIYLVDPKTGAVKSYPMGRVPAFVDQVIPTKVAEDWNDWYGRYVHGFWNAHFSQEDVKLPTHWKGQDEVNGVFDHRLALNWFTDFTRPKSGSGSMVGFSMINARTGALYYYKDANGTLNGKSAMNVAEKTFRAQKYVAGTPTVYMIYGQFTWVVPLMDSNHVLREMMLINAKDEKVYSAGEIKRKLFDDYKYALATKMGNDRTIPTDVADLKTLSGVVTHVYKAESDHGTITKFMIKGSDKIFEVSSSDFPYSIFLEKGVKVEIKYIDTDEVVATVDDFKMSP